MRKLLASLLCPCAYVVAMLAAGCGQPPLAGSLEGAWAVQSINGQAAPEWARDRVAVVFAKDGTCQRGGDVGTFEIINGATIRTRLGDRVELLTVEVEGDTLRMNPADSMVTVLERAVK